MFQHNLIILIIKLFYVLGNWWQIHMDFCNLLTPHRRLCLWTLMLKFFLFFCMNSFFFFKTPRKIYKFSCEIRVGCANSCCLEALIYLLWIDYRYYRFQHQVQHKRQQLSGLRSSQGWDTSIQAIHLWIGGMLEDVYVGGRAYISGWCGGNTICPVMAPLYVI